MKKLFLTLLGAVLTLAATAQNYTGPFYWNLLNEKYYDQIVGEASGDLAFYHVLEMAPYEKDRKAEEYRTYLHETKYLIEKMKEYGLPGATVEIVGKSKTWDGISGSLWEVSPHQSKIIDYKDLAASLASGSQNADVEAELVWVGRGTAKEMDGINMNGKIIVTEGSAARALAEGNRRGAVGVISFASSRPLVDPIQVPNSGIGQAKGFGFQIPPRMGYPLRDRLLAGEKIKVHAKVEALNNVEVDLQVPTCYIKGSDDNAGEIIFVAHLFEGYTKMGANDNTSGCAALLEIARTLNTLIEEGKIERPKRSMRFIWGAEFSATGPWAMQHKNITDKTIFSINLDMVGLWLSKSQSYYCLHRTTMGNSHYVNDLAESVFHYVGATNKAFTATGVGRPEAVKPIYSVTGSQDPFYYAINAHYGASDHEVFNDFGVQVPSIINITWTDNYYHTSGDRPAILDPTQLKRAVVIAAVTAYTAAIADETTAIKIAGEVTGNAAKRIGLMAARNSAQISAADQTNLTDRHKKASFDIEAQANSEITTLKSVKELAPQSNALQQFIDGQIDIVKEYRNSSLTSIRNEANAKAAVLGLSAIKSVSLTAEETAASKVFPKATAKVKETGYGVMRQVRTEGIKLPDSSEAAKLTKEGIYSILDIKKMLDAQFPTDHPLSELTKYLTAMKEAGLVTF